jgi:hypothetical protein
MAWECFQPKKLLIPAIELQKWLLTTVPVVDHRAVVQTNNARHTSKSIN